MLDAIITWSLNNRLLVFIGSTLLIGAGVLAMLKLPIDAFPDTTPVQLQINTIATALAPEEVERQITFPIEQVLGGLPGLQEVRSISKFGLSQIVVTFSDDTDVYFARNLISERLSGVVLQPGVGTPRLGPVTTGLGEVLHYAVKGEGKSLSELRAIQDWIIKPALRTVPGVAEINSWGGDEKQYQIRINPRRMIEHHVNFDQVISAVRDSYQNVGGGTIQESGESFLVHGLARPRDLSEIGEVVIPSTSKQPIYLRDVANIELGSEIRRGAATAEGRGEVVLGLGFMMMGENSHRVTRSLIQRIHEIEATLPEGVRIEILYDRTELVDHVIDTVRSNLFEGGLLVIAVLFVFLGNLRAGLIVALAIPLSMLFAFMGMSYYGISASLLSLGALDFGLVVDSSVVLIENVVRHLAHGDALHRDKKDVVREAAIEVRKPTLFGELIILIVYLPILTLEGVEGKLFKPMALTVIFALLGSMVLSLTLMPVLAATFLPKKIEEREPLPVRIVQWVFMPILKIGLIYRYGVLMLAAGLLMIAVMMFRGSGAEFLPRLSEGAFAIGVTRLAGTDIDEINRQNMQIERALLKAFPDEIQHVWSRCGSAEVATDPMGIELTDTFISLTTRDKWKRASTQAELLKLMEAEIQPMLGQAVSFTQPIEQRVNEMIAGVKSDVAVKIYGDDFKTLSRLSKEVDAVLRDVQGCGDVALEQLTGQPVLQIQLKLDQLAKYGLPARAVLDYVEAIGTKPVGEMTEGQLRFPLVIRLAEEFRANPTAIGEIIIPTPKGEQVPLTRLATIRSVEGPATISRDWGQRRTVVQCNVRDRDMGGFVEEAREQVLKRVKLPPRYRIEWGGTFENMERATLRLMIVVPVALVAIFILLYMTFNSVIDALRVYSGVPFAMVGGVIALWMRELPFSVSAAVGFIALSGVSVLNSMLLVTFIRQLTDRGVPITEAVTEAVRSRMRPVLMTAFVASLGFVPMAISTGMGAEVQQPLATVVIGGVVSSTLLTLFVLPAIYRAFSRS